MSTKFVLAAVLAASLSSLGSAPAVRSMEKELETLFHTSLDFYDELQRTEKGLYLDAHVVGRDKRNNHHCSTAAVGIGLMALCMEHELGRDPAAGSKALQTLRALNGKAGGFKPSREKAGFFRHFFSAKDGSGRSEHSTIDTAIMVVGALFCRNSFDDPQIKREADTLWNSVDWQLALASPDGKRLHMVIDGGKPRERTVTQLFNEYYLLAWLIRESQLEKSGHSQIVSVGQLPSWTSGGLNLLSDPRLKPQCSFLIQFPLYMCHPCTDDASYLRYVTAQAKADQRACSKRNGSDELWGCGAGGTPTGGYHASTYANNPEQIVSPRIIAGFLPAYPAAREHLLKLYRNPDRRLETPVGDLLPRFSVDKPDWRPRRIESIDFASMLFGLAAIHPQLGTNFFHQKTTFTFNQ